MNNLINNNNHTVLDKNNNIYLDSENDIDNSNNNNENENIFKKFFLDSIGNYKKKKFNNQKDRKNIKGNNNKDGTVIIKSAMIIKQGICYSKKATNK